MKPSATTCATPALKLIGWLARRRNHERPCNRGVYEARKQAMLVHGGQRRTPTRRQRGDGPLSCLGFVHDGWQAVELLLQWPRRSQLCATTEWLRPYPSRRLRCLPAPSPCCQTQSPSCRPRLNRRQARTRWLASRPLAHPCSTWIRLARIVARCPGRWIQWWHGRSMREHQLTPVVLADGTAVFGTLGGKVVGVSMEGQQVFSVDLHERVYASPLVMGDFDLHRVRCGSICGSFAQGKRALAA